MQRKRLTQILPFLIPIRTWQKNLFYQIHMKFDHNKYAEKKGPLLPYVVASQKSVMINKESGYDIIYQENKVYNLKIISKTMDKILIYPNEVFSFCYLSKNSKKYGKYKKGLIFINGKIVASKGGGICHLSNLLYYTFLHTPLTIIERYGHNVKSFPNPDKNSLDGVDCTISDGWLDLKVKNETNCLYQISIEFDDEYMYVKILSSKDTSEEITIANNNFKYIKQDEKIFESVDVIQIVKDKRTHALLDVKKLYTEIIEVGYKLSGNEKIEEM